MKSLRLLRNSRRCLFSLVLVSAGLGICAVQGQSEGPKPDPEPPKPIDRELQRERAEIRETVEKMRGEINALRQAVQQERAPRPGSIERPNAREGMVRPMPRLRAPGGPLGEPERRLRSLLMAIENLHAAGLPEAADRLNGEVERIRRQMEERRGALSPAPVARDVQRRPQPQPGEPMPPPAVREPMARNMREFQPGRGQQQDSPMPSPAMGNEQLTRTIRELQGQITELRQTVQELRAKIQQVAEPRR